MHMPYAVVRLEAMLAPCRGTRTGSCAWRGLRMEKWWLQAAWRALYGCGIQRQANHWAAVKVRRAPRHVLQQLSGSTELILARQRRWGMHVLDPVFTTLHGT